MKGELKMTKFDVMHELRRRKEFFANLYNGSYQKGDRIRSGDVKINGFNDVGYEGTDLKSLVNDGVLEVVGKEFVWWRSEKWADNEVISPEKILSPDFNGTVYTRKVYRIKIDNFEDYLEMLIEEL